MRAQKRIYDEFLTEHLAQHRQMILVTGPRRVGNTTTCRNLADAYANWDNSDDRERILAGPDALIKHYKLDRLSARQPTLLFRRVAQVSAMEAVSQGLLRFLF